MTKSTLQIARASYVPKIPAVFKGNIQIKEGEATASVDDQEEIKKLFPHIYGLPILTFVETEGQSGLDTPVNVGVILSGGQAPADIM